MKKFLALITAIIALFAVAGCCSGKGEEGSTEPTEYTEATEATEDWVFTEATESATGEQEAQTVQAVITMESGNTITLELYPDIAPITVENFKNLCEEGFYNGLTFHRIISGFMIQGGDPNGNGTGGPGYTIKGEFEANGITNDLKHERGVISMARSQAFDSAGSQFFIMHEDAPHLDGQYAAFGKVIDGMDTVDQIASEAVYFDGQTPLEAPVIESIVISE